MPALTTVRKNAIVLVVLLAVNLVLMAGSSKDPHGATSFESALTGLSAPFVAVAGFAGGGLRAVLRTAHDIAYARAKNARLQSDLRRLSDEAVRLREADRQNHRLRRLLAMREALVPESIAAEVVTSKIDDQTKMIVVDRGRKDGVTENLGVVAWGGVVGRVIVADRAHSKVQLLSDANSGVAAVVQRSRVQGIVVGGAERGLDLLYVPKFSDVMHGDRVVSSGLDGVFPRGFGIGRVSSITETPGGSQTIHLETELDYRRLEEVLIVLEPPAGEKAEG